jgi:hypothetical protein
MRRSLAVALASLLLGAAPARADDVYTTSTCRAPDGRPAPTDGWTAGGDAATAREDACARGGALTSGPSLADAVKFQSTWWTFTAPPGTRIAAYSLFRTTRPAAGSGWAWNWSLFRDVVDGTTPARYVETCFGLGGCPGLGDGTVSDASRRSESGVDLSALIAYVDCNPGACPAGSGPSLISIPRADFTLRDLADPTLTSTPSGDLIDTTQPLTGVRSVSFSASDQGGGVYQAILEVDGRAVTSTIIDANGGHCVPPFTGAVPCKPSAGGTLSYDTAGLPDGTHAFRLVITDPTGTNSASYGPVQVRTQNQTAQCDPNVASAASPVLAKLKGTGRSAITRASGRTTVSGRIVGVGAGVAVNLLTRERRSGAPAVISATAVTEADGSFSLAVPAGPSRRLRAARRINPSDRYLICSKPLDVRVPARASFKATPRVLRAGSRVRLTGRLLGGRVPSRGKLVDLQAREQGRWRTFATVRTKPSGAFAARYRFRGSAPRRTYPMRVRIRPDAAYPFAVGYSKSVKVRVR